MSPLWLILGLPGAQATGTHLEGRAPDARSSNELQILDGVTACQESIFISTSDFTYIAVATMSKRNCMSVIASHSMASVLLIFKANENCMKYVLSSKQPINDVHRTSCLRNKSICDIDRKNISWAILTVTTYTIWLSPLVRGILYVHRVMQQFTLATQSSWCCADGVIQHSNVVPFQILMIATVTFVRTEAHVMMAWTPTPVAVWRALKAITVRQVR